MKNILIMILFSILAGCSSEVVKLEKSFIVEIISISAWHNLMPGGPPSFHIGGELTLKNESEKDEEIQLIKISVQQQDNKFYEYTPSLEPISGEEGYVIKNGEKKEFLFSTPPGIMINPDLNENVFISAVLHFTAGDYQFSYYVDSLFIEKAY